MNTSGIWALFSILVKAVTTAFLARKSAEQQKKEMMQNVDTKAIFSEFANALEIKKRAMDQAVLSRKSKIKMEAGEEYDVRSPAPLDVRDGELYNDDGFRRD